MSDSEEETLECESQSYDAFGDLSVHVEEDKEARKERLAVENFARHTCKCSLGVGKKACSYQFTLKKSLNRENIAFHWNEQNLIWWC